MQGATVGFWFAVARERLTETSPDPQQEWNLSLAAFGFALERALTWDKPTLLLGGGGYHSANAARAWTYLTSVAVSHSLSARARQSRRCGTPAYGSSLPALSLLQLGRPLSLDAPIPPDLPTAQYEQFAPDFTLDVPAGHVPDRNSEETIARVEAAFATYAERLARRKRPTAS